MPTLKKNVLEGLTSKRKRISPKYLYDDNGSDIFRQIMALPEYYLTNAEAEILSQQAVTIYESMGFPSAFNIVELGSGDGKKTIQFLKAINDVAKNFTYVPMDISGVAFEKLSVSLQKELPRISFKPLEGDYFQLLKKFALEDLPSVFLFLGANIGNYPKQEAIELLCLFAKNMKPKDKLLIGFDLRKNPILIQQAYDDSQGVTRSFFLNLLKRINRELDGEFNLEKFDYYCHYNPENGEVNSYLISLQQQQVNIGTLNKVISFNKGESIWVEMSKKYDLEEIQALAQASGFNVINTFTDTQTYFVNSLLEKH